jgi:regulator of cell morphogenesis and NO signaling
MTESSDNTLGDLVTANPAAARILERHGLDYCCGGHHSLLDACAAAGVDERVVRAELDASDQERPQGWTQLDAPALARHIVDTHHRYLHEELPLLEALAAKVVSVHGTRHPELADVCTLVTELRADLEPHLLKEEQVLFPAIDALVRGQRTFGFGTVANPIGMMQLEHEQAGQLLAELRAVSYSYEVPADACASYRSLYERLAALEADTHEHIHKENNALFPAVMELAGT